jgi:lipid A oxidase
MQGIVAVRARRIARAGGSGIAAGKLIDIASALLVALAVAVWANAVLLDNDAAADKPRGASPPGMRAGLDTAETMIAGYVGAPWTHPSDLRFEKPGVTNLTVHDVHWEGRPFKSPIYYGVRAARWFGGSLGTMVDFTHSKAIAVRDQQVRFSGERNNRPAPQPATIGNSFRHMEFSHGHNMLTLNGLLRLWPASARIVPYVGAGGGVNLPHTEVQFADEKDRTYAYQYTGPVGQLLAGIEVRLPASSIFIEYKFTLSRYVAPLTGRDSRHSYGPDDFWWQLVAWWRGEKPANGTVTTTLASHQLISGVGYRHVSLPTP